MTDWRSGIGSLLIGASLALAGCGGGTDMPMGPGGVGPGGMAGGPAGFMSVTPGGGTTGVAVDAHLQFRWGAAMGPGMEQLIDLHRGDLSGPVVPISCAWSGDRTTLVCTPSEPLAPGATYAIHVGGGMVDATGQVVDMEHSGPGLGGQWISGGGPGSGGHHGGAHHGGQPWGGLGPGWQHANGSYGMAFTFTTA